MNILLLRLVSFLVVLFSCTALSVEPLNQRRLAELNKQLEQNEKRYGTVSQSILVKKQGQEIYRANFGLSSIELATEVNENNQYPVYSLAKLFASVAIMSLAEQGKVDLDQSIGFYLQDLPEAWQNISVRHCLNHTSGIPEYFSMEYVKGNFPSTVTEAINKIADKPFQFNTGDSYNYNNTNFLIIGAIIEKLAKVTYVDYVQKTIIEPLELQSIFYASATEVIPNLVSSYWGDNGKYTVDKGVNWPVYSFVHSGLYSNKADLQRFIDGIVAGRVLAKETLYKMWQPTTLNNGKTGGYASGWQYTKVGDFVRVGHEGGNRVRVDYHFKPDDISQNYTSIYLTNGNGFSGITTHLVDSLMSIIAPDDFPTLVLLESMLDGTFNNTLKHEGSEIVKAIDENEFITEENRAQFMMERGWTVYFNSYPESAVVFFEFYTKHNPSDARGWSFLAESWVKLGDKAKAIQFFRKVITLDKENSYARKRLKELSREAYR